MNPAISEKRFGKRFLMDEPYVPGMEPLLYRQYWKFLDYRRPAEFSNHSIQALEIRLSELRSFARNPQA
jgi:hypothetical protein